MKLPVFSERTMNQGRRPLLPLLLALTLALALRPASGQGAEGWVALPGHRTAAAAAALDLGGVAPSELIPLTLGLAPRDPAGLADLIRRQQAPQDPLYHHFLTPAQFVARFSPTPAQYAAVAAFARAQGLLVTGTTPNRLLLRVEAPSAAVESAFGVGLHRLQDAHGRLFRAPDAEPMVPASLAPLLTGVAGLDTSAVRRPHFRRLALADASTLAALPLETGSGPGGGLTPSDIKAAYNLSKVSLNGAGQTLAVFELDGYNPTDISAYEHAYGLPNVPLQNVIVDSGPGALNANGGQPEVTLDIELEIALAPGASQVRVYEGPNTGQGLIDTYNKIATDDLAKQVSTSWGLDELDTGASFQQIEEPIFQQMASQGQSVYAAAGDSGAYDAYNTNAQYRQTLCVDDPASQPYVTGTGGTSLATSGAGGAYRSETVWDDGAGDAGGGGISALWAVPAWQQGVGSAAGRNVPDVSLDADPNTGYSVYVQGGWAIYGGTSCAAPLWTAYTALVNQQRIAGGAGVLGFATPPLYAAAQGPFGAGDFHDITSGNNLYYLAVAGYDDATGWGSFNGASLLADLAPPPPAGLTAAASGTQISLTWNTVPSSVGYTVLRGVSHGGPYTVLGTATGAAYTDTGLTPGAAYFYVVTARTSAETSVDSGEATAMPPVVLAAPAPPTIATAAAAGPNPVTGTAATLSVLGADAGGEASLTYTWAATGPAPVTFSANGTNAAKNATATFTQAGSDTLTVTVQDAAGLTATSSVLVTVQQTPTALSVTPATASVLTGATQAFQATVTDQFGATISSPTVTWSVSGGGSISSYGVFTAGLAAGTVVVSAASGGAHGSAAVTVSAPVNNSAFVSQTIPTTMTTGQTYPVSVTYQNTGTTTWTAAALYRLVSQDPPGGRTWGTTRAYLSAPVPPGQSTTFSFTVTAPAAPGAYPMQWSMLLEGVQTFGPNTPVVSVTVSAPVNNSAFVSQTIPTTMTTGQTYPVSVTYQNTGTTTWTAAALYRLVSQDPPGGRTWGTTRAYLSAPVPPGQSTTFSFTVTAPAAPGAYPMQWSMLLEGVQTFGPNTPVVSVAVVAAH